MILTHIIILNGILLGAGVSGAPQQLTTFGNDEWTPLPSRSNEQASRFKQNVHGVQENHVRFKTGGSIDAPELTTTIHSPQHDINTGGLQTAQRPTIAKSGDISWMSPEGYKISMNYIADENGFRLQNNGFSMESTEEYLPLKSKAPSAASAPLLTVSSLSMQNMEDRAAQEFGYGRRYYFATRHGSQKLNPHPSEDLAPQNFSPSMTSSNSASMEQPQSPPHTSISPIIPLLKHPSPAQIIVPHLTTPTQSGSLKPLAQSSTPSLLPLLTMQPTPRPTLPLITSESTPSSVSLESSFDLPVSEKHVPILLPSSSNRPSNRLQLQSSSFPEDLSKSSLVTTHRVTDLRHELASKNALSTSEQDCKDFIPDPALFKMDPRNLSLSDRQQLLHYILVALTTESRIDGCSHGCTRFGSAINAGKGMK